jgi:hypothetical protein
MLPGEEGKYSEINESWRKRSVRSLFFVQLILRNIFVRDHPKHLNQYFCFVKLKTMKNTNFQMTPFQHAMNPIICIGMSDGKFTSDEMEDLKSSAAIMAGWFQLSKEQAWLECEALVHHIEVELSQGDPRFIYMKVPISCALIHKHVKNFDDRNFIIRLLEDQATADGDLTDDERQLINMYSSIILRGGETVGIRV